MVNTMIYITNGDAHIRWTSKLSEAITGMGIIKIGDSEECDFV